jgi:microsomal epoxide hydrolase
MRSGFVTTVDGVRIHYLEDHPKTPGPHRPPLLFIPGWTMPAEIWQQQLVHFSKTRRVVAMDPRSQGLSSQTAEGNYPEARARDIKAVVDRLRLAPVVLVGWSMAVAELAAYVDQFGCDDLAALVLVDGMLGGSKDPQTALGILNFAGSVERERKKATSAFVRSMFRTPQSEDYLDRLIQASLRTPTDTAIALQVGMLTGDREPGLAKIVRPSLIIGAESPYSGRYDELHKRIAGSRLEIFQNVGHALFVDDAERFNAILEDFLNTLGP